MSRSSCCKRRRTLRVINLRQDDNTARNVTKKPKNWRSSEFWGNAHRIHREHSEFQLSTTLLLNKFSNIQTRSSFEQFLIMALSCRIRWGKPLCRNPARMLDPYSRNAVIVACNRQWPPLIPCYAYIMNTRRAVKCRQLSQHFLFSHWRTPICIVNQSSTS